ncbi:MAG: SAM-dependent methyltransferase [Variovorax paradoxus]|nr:MAG: SAM-dependent methyltransferase [Variovorax paradoxus]PZQ00497.1 MAG: SAM-dependent methyltransferase [Variovorax paradoxus]
MTQIPGTAGYGAHAAALADQYESLSFADLHRDVLHLFPTTPSHVLDIGAGSGRDAAALALSGHQVTAVEPTAELRAEGQRRHAALGLAWVDDHLPHLHRVRALGRRFDLVLLTAVWMHLDAPERAAGMPALAQLVAHGGQVVMSLRHGPVPDQRRMFDVSAEETIALAAEHGFTCHHRGTRGDVLGRDGVWWSVVALRRNG